MNMQTTPVEGYVTCKIEIAGSSLIMHNGQTADPTNEFAKAMKSISGKRNKTDADFEDLSKLEYEAGLYLNKDEQVIVPSVVLEAAIHGGAKKSKEGKQALSGLFVETDMVLNYDGGPLTVAELRESEDHVIKANVRVGQSRVVRTRPHFQNWSGSFDAAINTEVSNPADLARWVQACGRFVGLCDWRPRHGRFEVVSFTAE